jgi:hypothetical protein
VGKKQRTRYRQPLILFAILLSLMVIVLLLASRKGSKQIQFHSSQLSTLKFINAENYGLDFLIGDNILSLDNWRIDFENVTFEVFKKTYHYELVFDHDAKTLALRDVFLADDLHPTYGEQAMIFPDHSSLLALSTAKLLYSIQDPVKVSVITRSPQGYLLPLLNVFTDQGYLAILSISRGTSHTIRQEMSGELLMYLENPDTRVEPYARLSLLATSKFFIEAPLDIQIVQDETQVIYSGSDTNSLAPFSQIFLVVKPVEFIVDNTGRIQQRSLLELTPIDEAVMGLRPLASLDPEISSTATLSTSSLFFFTAISYFESIDQPGDLSVGKDYYEIRVTDDLAIAAARSGGNYLHFQARPFGREEDWSIDLQASSADTRLNGDQLISSPSFVHFLRDPVWQAIGAILTLVGLALSLFLERRRRSS